MEVLEGYRLWVRFHDGTEGLVDLSARVMGADAGVFAGLQDKERFAEVYLDLGAVTWPGEIDLAPDAMHREITLNGSWMLK